MACVSYGNSIDCGQQFKDQLTRLIRTHSLTEVCDIGGGANPILDQVFHRENGLSYTVLDISQTELNKSPSYYHKVCADITQRNGLPENKWDLVFSQALAEHVKDGKAFHENVYRILKPGGYAIHLFPTLFAFPFLVNRLMPERVGSKLLDLLLPRDRYQNDKFPAYYSWCKGPTKSMVNRLEEIGFTVTDYKGLFGHRYYRFVPLLQKLQNWYAEYLCKHPTPLHTSYVIQILHKPLPH